MVSKESFIVILLIFTLLTIYVFYVLFSFCFLYIFKKKILISKNKLNIFLYQIAQSIFRTLNLIDDSFLSDDLLKFKNDNKYKKYVEFDANIFRENYLILDDIFKKVSKLVNNKSILNKEKILIELEIIEDCEKDYFSTTQIYNSYVIGYNYWRNLLFTKRVKDLFKVELKKIIN